MIHWLLTALIAIFLSIIANLLTPFVKPLWGRVMALQERGQRARLEREIQSFQVDIDQLNRFKGSERDLYLYLFRWLLGIMSFFVAAAVCGTIGFTNTQPYLITVALILLILAGIITFSILGYCSYLTTAGTEKRIAVLQNEIAERRAKLSNQ